MAVYEDRESFIPYRKADIIELCIEDGKLSSEDQQKFREFCEILSAYYHFECHETLENLKNNFSPFDPDADTKPRVEPTQEQVREMQQKLIENFGNILRRANYTKLSEEALEKALEEESLITLRLDVDFDDFEEMEFYHRGSTQETVEVKKFPFKKVDFTMDIYERVVLLIKFKDEEHFKKKGAKVDKLNFTPGKMYVYLFKKIPQADIEVLFPNVEIGMNWKDRLMLVVPAVGAGIPVILKALPALTILAVLAITYFNLTGIADFFGIELTEAKADTMKTVIAAMSGLGVLGGFAFKQYVKYKNKRIAFLKDVTDTLFFRNLDSNAGVFNAIVDAAEEEECKEVILAYYHLLTSETGMNQEQLDDTIEQWLEKKFDTHIDFDVDKALHKLESMRGKIVGDQDEDSVPETPLVRKDENGVLHCLTIDESKTVVDYVWDNFFDYN